jgi:lysophospholipase L1-like esterase
MKGRLARGAVTIVVALSSLALTLALAEGALALLGVGDSASDAWRTRGLQQADDELIYSMRPSSQRVWETEEFVERARVNALGLRGREISADSEERFRIVVLGDSMTYGHGVANGETYPYRLQELLGERRPGLDAEVINAGTRGYGSDHCHKLFMTRLRPLGPRIVVFALNYNDLADNLMYPLYFLEDDRLVPLDATRSPLYKVALWSERVPEWLAEYRLTRLAVRSGVAIATRGYGTVEPGQNEARVAQRKMVLALEGMAAAAAEDGFRLLVLGLPMKDEDWKPFTWLDEPLDGVAPLLDLSLDPSWREQKERWFFPINDHFNPAGNLRVAEILYEDLEARGWLER